MTMRVRRRRYDGKGEEAAEWARGEGHRRGILVMGRSVTGAWISQGAGE